MEQNCPAFETERQPYTECLASPRAPQGESGCPRDSVELPTLPPLGLQASPCAPSPPRPACSGDCCSPPWLLYLFILHQQGCCRLILARFKKRERKKKKEKCFLALLSTSVLAAGSCSSNSSSGPAGRRGVRYTGRCGPRGSLNGTGPQPWTDVVPNLMPPSGFSGKCPHLLS